MAARLGLEIYELVNRFARKLAAKPNAEGIMQIPNQEVIRDLSNEILTKFMKHNVPREALNSENDIKVIYNQIKNMEEQTLSKNLKKELTPKKSADVLELTGKKIDTSKPILGGKKVPEAEVKQIFMADKDFKDLRYSFRQNIIKNDRQFNKDLATQIINREIYTDLSKGQRKNLLDDLDQVFKGEQGLAHGGRTGTGLNYLLGEDDQNMRVPYKTGLKVYPQASVRIGEADIENLPSEITPETKDITYGGTIMGEKDGLYGGVEGIKIKNKIDYVLDNQTLFKDTSDDEKINFILGKKSDDYDLRLKIDKELKNALLSWNWQFNEGGRVPFKDGSKFDPKRRTILKGIAALATLPVIGKYFKWAKPLAKTSKTLTSVPIKNIKGMPAWFKPLVNKVIKEGDDVSKKFSTQERQIVHKTELPDSKTEVVVTQDLTTGDVAVEIGRDKHGFADGLHGQPVRLEYKAGEWIEPTKTSKGIKTKDEFWVEEAEFTGGHPENIKFEESSFNKYGEHGSDFSEVEEFAIGLKKGKGGSGHMASGGRVPLAGGKKPKYKKSPLDWLDLVGDDLDPYEWENILRGLGALPYQTGGRVPFSKGKRVLEGLAKLMDEFFPGTTKLGQTSRPMASKTELKQSIAGFLEREKAAKNKITSHAGDAPRAGEGKFSKAEVLIQMLENTIKGSKDSYVKKNFPNFIKEIKANPELANDPNVWGHFTKGLPKNQRLVVYGDDTVDFWRQSDFGPQNIETTNQFMTKHPYFTREQAIKIQNMQPEDQILEMKRLETIRNRTKQATGGRVPMFLGGGLLKGKEFIRQLVKKLAKDRDMTGSYLMKVMNPKAYKKHIDNPDIVRKWHPDSGLLAIDRARKLMKSTKTERANQLERYLDMAKSSMESDKNIQSLIDAGIKSGMSRESAEKLAKGLREAIDVEDIIPRNVTDETILELEQMLKNLKTKDRKLNATGGLAGMLGE